MCICMEKHTEHPAAITIWNITPPPNASYLRYCATLHTTHPYCSHWPCTSLTTINRPPNVHLSIRHPVIMFKHTSYHAHITHIISRHVLLSHSILISPSLITYLNGCNRIFLFTLGSASFRYLSIYLFLAGNFHVLVENECIRSIASMTVVNDISNFSYVHA